MKSILLSLLFPLLANAQLMSPELRYPTGIIANTNYVKNPGCFKNMAGYTVSGGTLSRNTTSPLNAGIGADCQWVPSALSQTLTIQLRPFDLAVKNANCSFYLPSVPSVPGYTAQIARGGVPFGPVLQLLSGTRASLPFSCGDLSAGTSVIIKAPTTGTIGQLNWSGAQVGIGAGVFQSSPDTVWNQYYPASNSWLYFGTVTNYQTFWRRVGSDMEIWGTFITGSDEGTSTGAVPLPVGICTPDRSRVTNQYRVGFVDVNGNTGLTFSLFLEAGRDADLSMGAQGSPIGGASGVGWLRPTSVSSNLGPGTLLGFRATIPCAGWTPQTAINTLNSNYDWTPYVPTFNGFGPVSNVSCFHKRQGPNLKLKCSVIPTAPDATIAAVSLPGTLTVDPVSNSVTANVGRGGLNVSTSAQLEVLASPNATALNFSYSGHGDVTNVNPSVGQYGSVVFGGGGNLINFSAEVPILGWSENNDAPQLIGSVTARGNYSYVQGDAELVCGTGGGLVNDPAHMISSIAQNSAGSCLVNFSTGYFGGNVLCVATGLVNGGQVRIVQFNQTPTPAGAYLQGFNNGSGSEIGTDLMIHCSGTR